MCDNPQYAEVCAAEVCAECEECLDCILYKSKCSFCPRQLCDDCIKEKYLREWFATDLRCSKCKKVTCSECMLVCHSCGNGLDADNAVFCPQCAPNLTEVCKHHSWSVCNTCKETDQGKCGECQANAGYDRYGL